MAIDEQKDSSKERNAMEYEYSWVVIEKPYVKFVR